MLNKFKFKYFVFLFLIILSLIIRFKFIYFESYDFTHFLNPWLDFIQSHGKFYALKYNFADYNVPYLYFLVISIYLPLNKLVFLKIISIIFDYLCAYGVYLIIKNKYKKSDLGLLGFILVLYLPTFISNSSIWGQCDSIYTSFIIFFLYYLIKKKNIKSMLFYGLAISFKLQAIFFLPILIILILKREISIKYIFYIVIPYVVLLIPALIAGRNIFNLLFIYINQAGSNNQLTLNASNLYQWIPNYYFYELIYPLTFFAILTIAISIFYISKKMNVLSNMTLVKLFLFFALFIPFILPKMHDRYFFTADALSVIYGFYFPKYFYIPILVQIISFGSYIPFLFGTSTILLPSISLITLILIIINAKNLISNKI